MKEIWKPIHGFESYYISNYGRVYSNISHKIMKTADNGLGYQKISLLSSCGKHSFYVHRLVAMTYIKNPDKKPVVNHIDNDPANNYFENLEWCTKQENTDWMQKQGRNVRTPIWLSRLHETQKKYYKSVRATNLLSGKTFVIDHINAAKNYGFSPGMVCSCCKGNIEKYKGYAFEYETAGAVRQRASALKRALNNAQEDKGYINTNES